MTKVKKKTAKPAKKVSVTKEDALLFHKEGRPGKISITPSKSLITQRDLSLAYSPGVAYPCIEINEKPETAYDYTSKGNLVAVISNGTAVLGLGNLGALASKPVMEGKSVLFKRFADIDSIDIEVDVEDPDKFIECVRYLSPTFGGVNLEDIKAPDCFIIEQKLRELMNVPVFHDDQHGTAIITAAGMINAADITGRRLEDIKLVVLGAGSAGIACLELIKAMGLKNAILVDRSGVIYKGRKDSMNQWKTAHAADTDARTLAEALKGADAFYGLAEKGAVTKEMVAGMAKNPIIFAMANPDPEITPEEIREVRDDAIIATGRSDYNNQINNVLGFPYIFRGALDVHASTINEEMKIAAAKAIAMLAREQVHDEVAAAYSGRKMEYGPEYIIPTPFDPRLISTVPVAVAQAAMDTGVARKPIKNMYKYRQELAARLNPSANSMNLIFEAVKVNPKTVVFAEGEEEKTIRAAFQWRDNQYGSAKLVGRMDKVEETIKRLGYRDMDGIEIINAANAEHVDKYVDLLYKKLQRKGFLRRDCIRMVKNDRNIFASCMLACGDGDTMVTGLTRGYYDTLEDVKKVIPTEKDRILYGLSLIVAKDRNVFIADTAVNALPNAEELGKIAVECAQKARQFGHEPRVALLSFSNFGRPIHERTERVRQAVEIMDSMKLDFEYDGDMSPDVALNPELLKLYPFCRLSKPANVLVMPNLHAANISSKLLDELESGMLIGPVLSGFEKPVQIATMGSTVAEILNLAAFGALEAIEQASKRKGKA
ncbi:MAG: NADP-dependent malic enzyme [Proteobacteria bacterium]|nr:NADP-dependent malic enzyme [Pseudomonadota bacterium]